MDKYSLKSSDIKNKSTFKLELSLGERLKAQIEPYITGVLLMAYIKGQIEYLRSVKLQNWIIPEYLIPSMIIII